MFEQMFHRLLFLQTKKVMEVMWMLKRSLGIITTNFRCTFYKREYIYFPEGWMFHSLPRMHGKAKQKCSSNCKRNYNPLEESIKYCRYILIESQPDQPLLEHACTYHYIFVLLFHVGMARNDTFNPQDKNILTFLEGSHKIGGNNT